jgi:hypothetical protein
MTMAGEATDYKRTKSRSRPYVVLREIASSTWRQVRTFDAPSAEGAVRQAHDYLSATESGDEVITLVAVSAARFQPIEVEPELQTRLKLTRL